MVEIKRAVAEAVKIVSGSPMSPSIFRRNPSMSGGGVLPRWQTPTPLGAGVWYKVVSLVALDIKNPPKLWRVNEITQPFVWGFPRGSIYVPTDLWERHAQERLNCSLTHELSHCIRLDAFVNLLQIIAQGIFWFHPFV